MRITARIALAATLAPIAVGLLGACSSGASGHGGKPASDAAGVAAVTASANPQAEQPTTPTAAHTAPTAHPVLHHSSGPAVSSGDDGNAAGSSGIGTQTQAPNPGPKPKPAAPAKPTFTNLTLTAPASCPAGKSITPKLSWTTKHTGFVGVSIDDPGAVSGYGAFARNATISLPAVQCTGPLGAKIAHRYDVWALAGVSSRHRVLHMNTTVTALITMPMPGLTLTPTPPSQSPVLPPFPMPPFPIPHP